MKINLKSLFVILILLSCNNLIAQDSLTFCRVILDSLVGKYIGKCKKGLADGKGEAIGQHRYEGLFKYGLPNGKGIYHYNDSVYHIGNFQDGIKEGKGETHYIRKELPDSIIKGYWSADEYRGIQYKTYYFNSFFSFDYYELTPSDKGGNLLTIEISTTSGAWPPGSLNGNGAMLAIRDLVSTNGNLIRKQSNYVTPNKTSSTYYISKFPVKLLATLSNGLNIQIELYKSADWTIRLGMNK